MSKQSTPSSGRGNGTAVPPPELEPSKSVATGGGAIAETGNSKTPKQQELTPEQPADAGNTNEQAEQADSVAQQPETDSTAEHLKSNAQPAPNDDDADIRALWTDDELSDPLTTEHIHDVPIGKPRNFFRTDPRREYRRKCEILVLKSENAVREQYYVIGPKMRGKIDEARPCTLITVVDRLGMPRLWPLMLPREGESDNDFWIAARKIARDALTKWVKILAKGKTYTSREAEEGYAPDPDFEKLPPFNNLVRTAFGEHGQINDENHPVYRDLFGKAKSTDNGGADGSDADPFS